MSIWQWTLVVAGCIVGGLVGLFLVVKLATWAYLVTTYRFEEWKKEHTNGEKE